MRPFALALLLALHLSVALATPSVGEIEQRLQALSLALRCPVCQNQNLAESNAAPAVELRHEIRTLIESGKSDDEIRAFLVARYGDFILYEPPFKPETLLLWLGPLFFFVLGLGLLITKTRRQEKDNPESRSEPGNRR